MISGSCFERRVLTSNLFRIAARLKGIAFQERTPPPGDLQDEPYLSINPNATLPTLVADYYNGQSVTLTQSLNMLEFLEDSYPGTRRLIPPVTDMASRVKVRDLATFIACDVQPLMSKRILNIDGIASRRRFLSRKLKVYQKMVEQCGGPFSVGNGLSIADICLVTTVRAASEAGFRFRYKRSPFAIIDRIVRECEKLPEFHQDVLRTKIGPRVKRSHRSSSSSIVVQRLSPRAKTHDSQRETAIRRLRRGPEDPDNEDQNASKREIWAARKYLMRSDSLNWARSVGGQGPGPRSVAPPSPT